MTIRPRGLTTRVVGGHTGPWPVIVRRTVPWMPRRFGVHLHQTRYGETKSGLARTRDTLTERPVSGQARVRPVLGIRIADSSRSRGRLERYRPTT